MLQSPTVRCYVHALVRQDLSHPALPPPSELCIQLLLLLPVPAEVLTRSIRWSMDWQRTGCLTLSRQLQGSNNPPVVGTESDNPRVMSVIGSAHRIRFAARMSVLGVHVHGKQRVGPGWRLSLICVRPDMVRSRNA